MASSNFSMDEKDTKKTWENRMNGIINVYKEKGFTSFDVCAKLRGILKTKKIGHTGTLDPEAEGVLPVCVGNATKLCDLLTEKDKEYEAVLLLGVTTDTEDMTGTILTKSLETASKERVEQVIHSFVGTYEQIPPMYSAIKINGQRLYELARQGKVVERKSRQVTIHSIQILDYKMDENHNEAVKEVRIKVKCSKGTYIRTLCKDIGEILGCGGCMKSLLRTEVSVFRLEDSLKLSQIEELAKRQELDPILMPVDACFTHLDSAKVIKEYDKYVYNGNKLKPNQLVVDTKQELRANYEVRVYDSHNTFTGIYEYIEAEECFKPVKMFLQ